MIQIISQGLFVRRYDIFDWHYRVYIRLYSGAIHSSRAFKGQKQ